MAWNIISVLYYLVLEEFVYNQEYLFYLDGLFCLCASMLTFASLAAAWLYYKHKGKKEINEIGEGDEKLKSGSNTEKTAGKLVCKSRFNDTCITEVIPLHKQEIKKIENVEGAVHYPLRKGGCNRSGNNQWAKETWDSSESIQFTEQKPREGYGTLSTDGTVNHRFFSSGKDDDLSENDDSGSIGFPNYELFFTNEPDYNPYSFTVARYQERVQSQREEVSHFLPHSYKFLSSNNKDDDTFIEIMPLNCCPIEILETDRFSYIDLALDNDSSINSCFQSNDSITHLREQTLNSNTKSANLSCNEPWESWDFLSPYFLQHEARKELLNLKQIHIPKFKSTKDGIDDRFSLLVNEPEFFQCYKLQDLHECFNYEPDDQFSKIAQTQKTNQAETLIWGSKCPVIINVELQEYFSEPIYLVNVQCDEITSDRTLQQQISLPSNISITSSVAKVLVDEAELYQSCFVNEHIFNDANCSIFKFDNPMNIKYFDLTDNTVAHPKDLKEYLYIEELQPFNMSDIELSSEDQQLKNDLEMNCKLLNNEQSLFSYCFEPVCRISLPSDFYVDEERQVIVSKDISHSNLTVGQKADVPSPFIIKHELLDITLAPVHEDTVVADYQHTDKDNLPKRKYRCYPTEDVISAAQINTNLSFEKANYVALEKEADILYALPDRYSDQSCKLGILKGQVEEFLSLSTFNTENTIEENNTYYFTSNKNLEYNVNEVSRKGSEVCDADEEVNIKFFPRESENRIREGFEKETLLEYVVVYPNKEYSLPYGIREQILNSVVVEPQCEYSEAVALYGPFHGATACTEMGQFLCTTEPIQSSFVPYDCFEEIDVTIYHSDGFAVVNFTSDQTKINKECKQLQNITGKNSSVDSDSNSGLERKHGGINQRVDLASTEVNSEGLGKYHFENNKEYYDVVKTKIIYNECDGRFVRTEVNENSRQEIPAVNFDKGDNEKQGLDQQDFSVNCEENVERICVQDISEGLLSAEVNEGEEFLNNVIYAESDKDDYESELSDNILSENTDESNLSSDDEQLPTELTFYSPVCKDFTYISDKDISSPRRPRLSTGVSERLRELAERYRDQELYGVDGKGFIFSGLDVGVPESYLNELRKNEVNLKEASNESQNIGVDLTSTLDNSTSHQNNCTDGGKKDIPFDKCRRKSDEESTDYLSKDIGFYHKSEEVNQDTTKQDVTLEQGYLDTPSQDSDGKKTSEFIHKDNSFLFENISSYTVEPVSSAPVYSSESDFTEIKSTKGEDLLFSSAKNKKPLGENPIDQDIKSTAVDNATDANLEEEKDTSRIIKENVDHILPLTGESGYLSSEIKEDVFTYDKFNEEVRYPSPEKAPVFENTEQTPQVIDHDTILDEQTCFNSTDYGREKLEKINVLDRCEIGKNNGFSAGEILNENNVRKELPSDHERFAYSSALSSISGIISQSTLEPDTKKEISTELHEIPSKQDEKHSTHKTDLDIERIEPRGACPAAPFNIPGFDVKQSAEPSETFILKPRASVGKENTATKDIGVLLCDKSTETQYDFDVNSKFFETQENDEDHISVESQYPTTRVLQRGHQGTSEDSFVDSTSTEDVKEIFILRRSSSLPTLFSSTEPCEMACFGQRSAKGQFASDQYLPPMGYLKKSKSEENLKGNKILSFFCRKRQSTKKKWKSIDHAQTQTEESYFLTLAAAEQSYPRNFSATSEGLCTDEYVDMNVIKRGSESPTFSQDYYYIGKEVKEVVEDNLNLPLLPDSRFPPEYVESKEKGSNLDMLYLEDKRKEYTESDADDFSRLPVFLSSKDSSRCDPTSEGSQISLTTVSSILSQGLVTDSITTIPTHLGDNKSNNFKRLTRSHSCDTGERLKDIRADYWQQFNAFATSSTKRSNSFTLPDSTDIENNTGNRELYPKCDMTHTLCDSEQDKGSFMGETHSHVGEQLASTPVDSSEDIESTLELPQKEGTNSFLPKPEQYIETSDKEEEVFIPVTCEEQGSFDRVDEETAEDGNVEITPQGGAASLLLETEKQDTGSLMGETRSLVGDQLASTPVDGSGDIESTLELPPKEWTDSFSPRPEEYIETSDKEKEAFTPVTREEQNSLDSINGEATEDVNIDIASQEGAAPLLFEIKEQEETLLVKGCDPLDEERQRNYVAEKSDGTSTFDKLVDQKSATSPAAFKETQTKTNIQSTLDEKFKTTEPAKSFRSKGKFESKYGNSRQNKDQNIDLSKTFNFWKSLENSNSPQKKSFYQPSGDVNSKAQNVVMGTDEKDLLKVKSSDRSFTTPENKDKLQVNNDKFDVKDGENKESKKGLLSKLSTGLHLPKNIGSKVSNLIKGDKTKKLPSTFPVAAKELNVTNETEDISEPTEDTNIGDYVDSTHTEINREAANEELSSEEFEKNEYNKFESLVETPEIKSSSNEKELLTDSQPLPTEEIDSLVDVSGSTHAMEVEPTEFGKTEDFNVSTDVMSDSDNLEESVSEEVVYQEENVGSSSLFYVLGSFRRKHRQPHALKRTQSHREKGLKYRTEYKKQGDVSDVPGTLSTSLSDDLLKDAIDSSPLRPRSRTPIMYRRTTSSEQNLWCPPADDQKYGFTVAIVRSRSTSVASTYSDDDGCASMASSGFERNINDFQDYSNNVLSQPDKSSSVTSSFLETDLDSVLINAEQTEKNEKINTEFPQDLNVVSSNAYQSSSTMSLSDDDSSCGNSSARHKSLKTVTVRDWPEHGERLPRRTRRRDMSKSEDVPQEQYGIDSSLMTPRSRKPITLSSVPSPAIGLDFKDLHSPDDIRQNERTPRVLSARHSGHSAIESDTSGRTSTPKLEKSPMQSDKEAPSNRVGKNLEYIKTEKPTDAVRPMPYDSQRRFHEVLPADNAHDFRPTGHDNVEKQRAVSQTPRRPSSHSSNNSQSTIEEKSISPVQVVNTHTESSFRPISSMSLERENSFRSRRSGKEIIVLDDIETDGLNSDDAALFSDTSHFDSVGFFDDSYSFVDRDSEGIQLTGATSPLAKFPRLPLNNISEKQRDIICANPMCSKVPRTLPSSSAYSSCIACFTYYCSKECRRADWVEHKRTCYYGRVHFYLKALLQKIDEDPNLLFYLSQMAVDNFHARGRGAVIIQFSSPMALKLFLIERTNVFPQAPTFACHSELSNNGQSLEQEDQLLQFVYNYHVDKELVVSITVDVGDSYRQNSNSAELKFKSSVIRRCITIGLHPDFLPCSEHQYSPASYEIRTFTLPKVGRHDFATDCEARRYYCGEISRNLRKCGVYLKRDYPEEYYHLCLYVEKNRIFEPLILFGNCDGRTYKCIVFPEGYREEEVLESSETGVLI